MQKYDWDKAFEKYENHNRKRKKNLKRLKKVLKYENLKRDIKIFDFFSGSGDVLFGLKERGFLSLSGGDVSLELIKSGKRIYEGINYIVMDARYPPLKSNQIDIVIIQGGLHHLNTITEIRMVLKEICRVLRKNGIFICSEPSRTFFLKMYLFFIRTPFYSLTDYTRYWRVMYDNEKTTYHHWLDNFNEIISLIKNTFFDIEFKRGIVTFFFRGRVKK